MNKAQFVEIVQAQGSYKTKIEAEAAIKAVTEAIAEGLAKKEDIQFVGFGTFSTAFQKGKTGTVPGTTKSYTSEDKYVCKFKAGTTLKDRVAAGK